MTPSRDPTSGFSLVEVLVALALFALIGSAGFAMLDQVLRTQQLTEGRLEKIAEMQRAMHLVRLDFAQTSDGSVAFDSATTPPNLSFRRVNPAVGAGSVSVVYLFEDDMIKRVIRRGDDTQAVQPLLRDVTQTRWRFLDTSGDWTEQWPPADRETLLDQPSDNPQAVELTVRLGPVDDVLRRVVLLPAAVQ